MIKRNFIWGKPSLLFITNFVDLIVSFAGGFVMKSGKAVISKK